VIERVFFFVPIKGSELVTNWHQLKMAAGDAKNYLTDAATAETSLRLDFF
jgi:DNA-damage-inducible protein D